VAIVPIRLFGDPVLRTPAAPGSTSTRSCATWCVTSPRRCRRLPGRGLPAPQIGVGLRVFTYQMSEEEPGHLVNPVLSFPDEEDQLGEEGLSSIPGLPFDCMRRQKRRREGFQHVRRAGDDRGQRAAGPLHPARDQTISTAFSSSIGSDSATKKAAMKAIREAEVVRSARAGHQGEPAPDVRGGTLRLVFAGTPRPDPAAFGIVDSAHEVVAVITRPDAPAGRGRRLTASPVAELARSRGLPVLTPTKPSEPEFPGPATGAAARLLPGRRLRALGRRPRSTSPSTAGQPALSRSCRPGGAPLRSNGRSSPVTTSPARQRSCSTGHGHRPRLRRPDRAIGHAIRPATCCSGCLSPARRLLLAPSTGSSRELVPQPQPVDGVSLAPKVTPDDARVDWSLPAIAIDRLVRGCTPDPARGRPTAGSGSSSGPSSQCPEVDLIWLPASCESNAARFWWNATVAVRLGEVQAEGKRLMPAGDGLGQPVRARRKARMSAAGRRSAPGSYAVLRRSPGVRLRPT